MRDFGRGEIGQLHAGLMDGRHLLLLLNLIGHIADRDDQVPWRGSDLADGRGMDVVVTVLAAAKRGTGGLGRRQGGMEGAKVGAEDLRAAQHAVKIHADHLIAAEPLAETAVAPDDRIVAVQQGHAVGHAFDDLLVLQQPADLQGPLQVLGGDIDPGKLLSPKMRQGTQGVGGHHHFVGFGGAGQQPLGIFARIADQEYSGLSRQ